MKSFIPLVSMIFPGTHATIFGENKLMIYKITFFICGILISVKFGIDIVKHFLN